MYVIAKRSILFVNQDDIQEAAKGGVAKAPRKHLVAFSKDPQEVPDWIRDQSAYETAAKDESIVEILYKATKAPQAVAVTTPAVVDLTKMKKDELQVHAQEVHGLELDDKLTKDDMIAAIKDAAATTAAKT
jgi:hypothetical protein